MNLETIIYEKQENIARIKFNTPQRLNAQTPQQSRDLVTALETARQDGEIRVVILSGNGKAFCAGEDFKYATEFLKTLESRVKFSALAQEVTRKARTLGKPIIAAVHGYALGAGMQYVTLCDIIIAAEGTKFGHLEASVGGLMEMGSAFHLSRLVGLAKAKELALTCDIIGADEAYRIGLLNRVVPLSDLESVATEMARKIAVHPALAIKLTKEVLDRGAEMTLDDTLVLEDYLLDYLMSNGKNTEEIARLGLERLKKK